MSAGRTGSGATGPRGTGWSATCRKMSAPGWRKRPGTRNSSPRLPSSSPSARSSPAPPVATETGDASATSRWDAGHAAQNLLLQAVVVLGLGSVPVGAFDDAAVARILFLPHEEEPLYLLPSGPPARAMTPCWSSRACSVFCSPAKTSCSCTTHPTGRDWPGRYNGIGGHVELGRTPVRPRCARLPKRRAYPSPTCGCVA